MSGVITWQNRYFQLDVHNYVYFTSLCGNECHSINPLLFTVQMIKSMLHWVMLSTWLELFSSQSRNKAGVPSSSLAVSRQNMSCFNILFLTKFHSCHDCNMRKTNAIIKKWNKIYYNLKLSIIWGIPGSFTIQCNCKFWHDNFPQELNQLPSA